MRKINLGDRVETIDDAIKGVVKQVSGIIILIEDDDGFEYEFAIDELILLDQEDSLNINTFTNRSISEITKEKEASVKHKSIKVKSKDRHKPTFVVDLHIHELIDSTRGMTNFDMLNKQIDTARAQLEFAIRQRMQKLVFIHGVGEGVLKLELQTLLGRYNNVTFYDADYKIYGLGATEVRIFQNVNP